MPFRWLCLTMHVAIIVILVFITEVIMAFAAMVEQAQEVMPSVPGAPTMSSLTSFNLSGLELMHSLVMPLVLIFTVANAIAPSIAKGGSKYNVLNNLGLTAAFSGISLLILPALADALFKSVSQM